MTKKGIRSTQLKVKTKVDIDVPILPAPVPQVKPPLFPLFVESWPYPGPAYGACTDATLIPTISQLQMYFVLEHYPIKSVG